RRVDVGSGGARAQPAQLTLHLLEPPGLLSSKPLLPCAVALLLNLRCHSHLKVRAAAAGPMIAQAMSTSQARVGTFVPTPRAACRASDRAAAGRALAIALRAPGSLLSGTTMPPRRRSTR